ncbi:ankyrin repeat domain-containing protein 31 isoform X5 [Danio rerio]
MLSPANTLRDQAVLTQEQNSPGRDHILHSEVVRPRPVQDTVSLDAPQRQPGPVLRHSTRKIVRTDLLDKMKSPPQQNTQRRSLPSKKKNPDTKALSTALPTRAKQTKPNFSQADNSPRTTDSGVNPSVGQSRNQNPIRDTRPPLQKTKRTADESEHEGSVQCSAAEPVPGPSREQPNLEPSAQTSTNELFVRNQEQDFSSQGSLLLQDQESEGSDTSSCPDSELTMDYIEDRSSSPQHWTLCATQDFSATNIG